MEALQKVFASLKFENIKTILASGNVIFTALETNKEKLTQEVETKLEKIFGYSIRVIIRTYASLESLVASNPYNGVEITPQTRLYITFLSEKTKRSLSTPYESPTKQFTILQATDNEVVTVLTISPEYNSTDLMEVLEKEFGKNITTRNWNTVVKIVNYKQ
jgi:uncharacterized protein (DUF1697 family)